MVLKGVSPARSGDRCRETVDGDCSRSPAGPRPTSNRKNPDFIACQCMSSLVAGSEARLRTNAPADGCGERPAALAGNAAGVADGNRALEGDRTDSGGQHAPSKRKSRRAAAFPQGARRMIAQCRQNDAPSPAHALNIRIGAQSVRADRQKRPSKNVALAMASRMILQHRIRRVRTTKNTANALAGMQPVVGSPRVEQEPNYREASVARQAPCGARPLE